MLMHQSVIDKVLYLCTNYGGHANERKLVTELNNLVLSPYQSEKAGLCLVDARTFLSERQARNLPTHDIAPMKLHGSVIQKIMYVYGMYSGHSNEVKFRQALVGIDMTPYERKDPASHNETVLVLTSEYMKTLQGTA